MVINVYSMEWGSSFCLLILQPKCKETELWDKTRSVYWEKKSSIISMTEKYQIVISVLHGAEHRRWQNPCFVQNSSLVEIKEIWICISLDRNEMRTYSISKTQGNNFFFLDNGLKTRPLQQGNNYKQPCRKSFPKADCCLSDNALQPASSHICSTNYYK